MQSRKETFLFVNVFEKSYINNVMKQNTFEWRKTISLYRNYGSQTNILSRKKKTTT